MSRHSKILMEVWLEIVRAVDGIMPKTFTERSRISFRS